MSENNIYGVDLDGVITPLMVRDAISECFYQAHCVDSGLGNGDPESVRKYCTETVIKAFLNSGGNYDNPTKDDIFKVLNQLADFSKNFRDPLVIKEHYNKIMLLVERLP